MTARLFLLGLWFNSPLLTNPMLKVTEQLAGSKGETETLQKLTGLSRLNSNCRPHLQCSGVPCLLSMLERASPLAGRYPLVRPQPHPCFGVQSSPWLTVLQHHSCKAWWQRWHAESGWFYVLLCQHSCQWSSPVSCGPEVVTNTNSSGLVSADKRHVVHLTNPITVCGREFGWYGSLFLFRAYRTNRTSQNDCCDESLVDRWDGMKGMNSGSLLVPSLCHRKGQVLLAWYCGSAGEGPGVVTLVLWFGRGRSWVLLPWCCGSAGEDPGWWWPHVGVLLCFDAYRALQR